MRILVSRGTLGLPVTYVVPEGNNENVLTSAHMSITTGLVGDSPLFQVTNRNGEIIKCAAPGTEIPAGTTATVVFGGTGTFYVSTALSIWFVPWSQMIIEEGDFVEVFLLATTVLNGGVKLVAL